MILKIVDKDGTFTWLTQKISSLLSGRIKKNVSEGEDWEHRE